MAGRRHRYAVDLTWTGNLGDGTATYRSYSRDNEMSAAVKPVLLGSADKAFRGDASRWNPEELLVASLSQCHLLSYLHLCAVNDVVVTAYVDAAEGEMTASADGAQMSEVRLHPTVTVVSADMAERASDLHADAHQACFIARSVNFPVRHFPTVRVAVAEGR